MLFRSVILELVVQGQEQTQSDRLSIEGQQGWDWAELYLGRALQGQDWAVRGRVDLFPTAGGLEGRGQVEQGLEARRQPDEWAELLLPDKCRPSVKVRLQTPA